MVITLFGITIEGSLTQLANVRCPMEVRLTGRVTEVILSQPSKAWSPMEVTPSEISIDGKILQSSNAPVSIFSRAVGRVTLVSF